MQLGTHLPSLEDRQEQLARLLHQVKARSATAPGGERRRRPPEWQLHQVATLAASLDFVQELLGLEIHAHAEVSSSGRGIAIVLEPGPRQVPSLAFRRRGK